MREQVLVITGASNGIGLATAELAGGHGARVVLTSRDEVDLERAVGRIRGAGGPAIHVAAAVALPDRAGIFGGGD
jgi:short-subunit dehydrogenase